MKRLFFSLMLVATLVNSAVAQQTTYVYRSRAKNTDPISSAHPGPGISCCKAQERAVAGGYSCPQSPSHNFNIKTYDKYVNGLSCWKAECGSVNDPPPDFTDAMCMHQSCDGGCFIDP